MDASTAWISSDRKDGEGGYDIYEMKTVKAIQPEAVVYVKGKVVDRNSKKPLRALVELSNVDKSEKVVEIMSDPVDGSFFIPVYPGVNYAFHITKKGYLFYSENMNLKDTLRFSPVHKTFELTPVSKGNSFVLNNIFFDFDSFTLKPASFTELNLLASLLKNNPSMRILIKGHTDNTGTDEYNLLLSENRAKAVYDYLTEHGIKQERLQYKGFGATQPVSSNETSEGRAENRRTEIEIL
jgi:outer membrane protein OmpA-like peptidoglycan-associated protein